MLRASVLFYCIYLAALTPYLAYAMTDAQRAKIHAHFEEMGKACMADSPITADDIVAFKSKKMATGPNAPCFVACVMKKCGVMDDHGMIQKETAVDLAKKVFEDPEEIKNIENYLHSCNHVNTAAVGDGEKGCERAVLAFNCMNENASQAFNTFQVWYKTAKCSVLIITFSLSAKVFTSEKYLHILRKILPGILSAALLTILVRNATAVTDDQRSQIQKEFMLLGAECLKDHPLNLDDISAFKEKKFPSGENAPCFTACVFKKIGILDDTGKLSQSSAKEHAKNVFKDEADLKKVEELLTSCDKVNDETVSDGDKGCDRSKLAYTCLIENSDKFGFNIGL